MKKSADKSKAVEARKILVDGYKWLFPDVVEPTDEELEAFYGKPEKIIEDTSRNLPTDEEW